MHSGASGAFIPPGQSETFPSEDPVESGCVYQFGTGTAACGNAAQDQMKVRFGILFGNGPSNREDLGDTLFRFFPVAGSIPCE